LASANVKRLALKSEAIGGTLPLSQSQFRCGDLEGVPLDVQSTSKTNVETELPCLLCRLRLKAGFKT
jgi:hypothetical protein